jgi:hypothetical protein
VLTVDEIEALLEMARVRRSSIRARGYHET